MSISSLPNRVRTYFDTHDIPTPYLLIDLDIVAYNYVRLCKAMPKARHYYAIKANPESQVLKTLIDLGGYFEVASVQEIDMCLAVGVPPEKILYGNPLKKEKEIEAAFVRGIREYVFDEYSELEKIARAAPGSKVICRIIADGKGAVSPLTIKFGAKFDKAEQWLKTAPELGVIPFGISFHTGSQQLMPESWEKPMMEAGRIFKALEQVGHKLEVVDVGGGFPVSYREEVTSINEFGKAIDLYAEKYFDTPPLLYTEPGRYMAGDAGFILSEVVQVSEDYEIPDLRWVYLDIGRYGGLVEEKIDYPVWSFKQGPEGPVTLSGQTCDSNDVIYRECFKYKLPLNLTDGDKVVLAYTGVYTTTYSTTLNGFPNLQAYCLPLSRKGKKATMNNSIYPSEFLLNNNAKHISPELFPQKGDVELCDTPECGRGVRALRRYKRGEMIGHFTGMVTAELLQHSLQVEPGMNIVDPYFVGYLLHDCDPNVSLDMHQQKVYALKDIEPGSYLSMDYASTEDQLFRQFPCMCDAPNCRLWITGRAETVNEEGLSYLSGPIAANTAKQKHT